MLGFYHRHHGKYTYTDNTFQDQGKAGYYGCSDKAYSLFVIGKDESFGLKDSEGRFAARLVQDLY